MSFVYRFDVIDVANCNAVTGTRDPEAGGGIKYLVLYFKLAGEKWSTILTLGLACEITPLNYDASLLRLYQQ